MVRTTWRAPKWAALVFLQALLFSTVSAKYGLVDNYTPQNFFDKFDFWDRGDPTNGHVLYVNKSYAAANSLIAANSERIYMGVDTKNKVSPYVAGRPSVRLQSKQKYTHGLFILDLNHIPVGCGTWPAWWTVGDVNSWPQTGEIDIIEGVNTNLNNSNKIYTGSGCFITGKGQTAIADSFDCSGGCGSASTRTDSYGAGFNKDLGGVYAMEWTSNFIRVWFFPRSNIPQGITSGNPDPSNWGLPTANFQGACDIDSHFSNHQIVFDITFCGEWAGPTFGKYGCPMTSTNAWTSCNAFVANHPEAFQDAYWDINSLKVYQQSQGGGSSVSAPKVSITDAVRLSSSVGVPLGQSGTMKASNTAPASQATLSGASSSPLAGQGNNPQHNSRSSSSLMDLFAEATVSSRASSSSPRPLSLASSSPAQSNGPHPAIASTQPSAAAAAAAATTAPTNQLSKLFAAASPQPCSPLSAYTGPITGFRSGIGDKPGGLAMCQGDCASLANCSDVLYVHYRPDKGSPLGYWDCWYGSLNAASVTCGGGGASGGSGGKAGRSLAARAGWALGRMFNRRALINMWPSPSLGHRAQDYQVFMHKTGTVASSGALVKSQSASSSSSSFSISPRFPAPSPSTPAGFSILVPSISQSVRGLAPASLPVRSLVSTLTVRSTVSPAPMAPPSSPTFPYSLSTEASSSVAPELSGSPTSLGLLGSGPESIPLYNPTSMPSIGRPPDLPSPAASSEPQGSTSVGERIGTPPVNPPSTLLLSTVSASSAATHSPSISSDIPSSSLANFPLPGSALAFNSSSPAAASILGSSPVSSASSTSTPINEIMSAIFSSLATFPAAASSLHRTSPTFSFTRTHPLELTPFTPPFPGLLPPTSVSVGVAQTLAPLFANASAPALSPPSSLLAPPSAVNAVLSSPLSASLITPPNTFLLGAPQNVPLGPHSPSISGGDSSPLNPASVSGTQPLQPPTPSAASYSTLVTAASSSSRPVVPAPPPLGNLATLSGAAPSGISSAASESGIDGSNAMASSAADACANTAAASTVTVTVYPTAQASSTMAETAASSMPGML